MWRTNCVSSIARGIELLVLTALTGCATVPKTEPASLPVTLQQSFGACHGRDGSALLTMETSEGSFRADVEWVARTPAKWDLELTNPMGQPLLLLRYKAEDGPFVSSGRLTEHIPKLNVDKNGFLTVDGHFIGIRPEELPCFFAFVLPSAWLDHTLDFQREKDEIRFMSYDRHRDITIEARHLSRPDERQVCARIAWSQYLGAVRREGSLCIQGTASKVATLQGFEGLNIQWRSAPGGGDES